MFRAAVLVAYDQDVDALQLGSVNDGVWKTVQREPAPLFVCWRPDCRVAAQQGSHAFKFIEKTGRQRAATLPAIEASSQCQIFGRARVQREVHARSARNRLRTSAPGSGML